jgi:trigger factor
MAEEQMDAMSEETEDKLKLSVEINDTGPARKMLSIEIGQDQIKKRFGSNVRDDVKAQLISTAYSQAIEDEGLDVIGEPDVKDIENIELPEEGSLSFDVEVEVAPTVELPDLEGIEVTRPTKTITDEDVDEQIETMCERFGNMQEVPDTEVADRDYVKCEVRILEGEDAGDDAPEIAHHPSTYLLAHGEDMDYKGHVVGILIDDLGKRVIGKKAGEVLRISMTGPAGHEDERIKGQPITVVITLNAVERLEPLSTEKLMEMMSQDSEEDMRNYFRDTLGENREQQAKSAMRDQISDALLEKIEMELPEGLSSRQTSRVLERTAMQMAMQGVPEQEIEQRVAEMRAESEETARKQLKLFFILSKVAEELEVSVSEGELNGQVAVMARQQGRRPERMRQEMARSGQLEQLYMQLREQKTLDAILEKAKVTEETVEETRAAKKKASKKKAAKKKASKKKSSKKKAAKKKEDD